VNSIGSGESWYPEIKPRGTGSTTAASLAEFYGVVTVQFSGESTCLGETFADLGHHAFIATILSRPFPHVAEMRKERAGELTVFDPTGCMLDADYLPADFLPAGYTPGAIAFVSLMYGGEIFDEEYNFKSAAVGADYVLPTDAYETFRPANSCKPFGWTGGARTGYTASIGPLVPNGVATFQVKLPEKGIYRITITYGDATDATDNQLELFDGDRLLATLTGTSEAGQTWVSGPTDHNFKSTNAPILKVTLSNASDRDSRIVKLVILQIDPPTQWEVINRCCVAKDTE
jgi:hypothetical protein